MVMMTKMIMNQYVHITPPGSYGHTSLHLIAVSASLLLILLLLLLLLLLLAASTNCFCYQCLTFLLVAHRYSHSCNKNKEEDIHLNRKHTDVSITEVHAMTAQWEQLPSSYQ